MVKNPKIGLVCMLAVFVSSSSGFYGQVDKFTITDQFNQLDFEYPSDKARQADVDSGVFKIGVPAPIDIDVYYHLGIKQLRKFVTIPRFQPGIPSTLTTIVRDRNGNPILRPYPSWDWHTNAKECKANRIVSVYRIMADECGRLWVLDNGQVDGDQVVCNPQLLTFDLTTDTLIGKYEIPANQWTINSTFVTPVVDVVSRRKRCKNTFVYMADCIGNSIVVYDNQQNTSWIVKDDTMKPDPLFEEYTIKGQSFQLLDGVLGMSISRISGQEPRLFYHAMTSQTEHYITTKDLQNKNLFQGNNYSHLIHSYQGTRKTQSAAEATDRDGIMYFGLMTNISVACFNTRGEYGIPGENSNIVADNQETLQFVSGAKVTTNPLGEQFLWILSSRFQKVATGTLNPKEVNFRIQLSKVKDLRHGSPHCDPRRYAGPRPGYPTTTYPVQNPTWINTNPGPVIFPTTS